MTQQQNNVQQQGGDMEGFSVVTYKDGKQQQQGSPLQQQAAAALAPGAAVAANQGKNAEAAAQPVAPVMNTPLKFCQVTQVLSGDCVVIQPLTPQGPQFERTLMFSSITAPRLERRPNPGSTMSDSKDEPCAWEAREFVRRKVIGQTVAYTVEHSVAVGTNRDYGVMFVGKTREDENLTHSLISEGLVEVRSPNKPNPTTTALMQLQEEAKQQGKGKWAADAGSRVRNVKWSVEPLRKFVEERKGKRLSAIVESVRDGCTLRVLLVPDFYYVTLSITGIKTPTFQYDAITGTQNPEPLSDEAKLYVEKRLLHREIKVVIEGVSGNVAMGTIFHPSRGNIAPYMLEDGIAKIVDWSLQSVTGSKDAYITAENKARAAQKGIWAGVEGGERQKNEQIKAKVIEINTAEAITILVNGREEKIKLSSLRGPRLDDNNQSRGKNFRPLYQIPCMFEARELLREKLIGNVVSVAVDYVQEANENFPAAKCCTVTYKNENVSLSLVRKGLATVVRHRRDDDKRSRAYEDLLSAESAAQKEKLGLHNPDRSTIRIADVCGEAKIAKNFLNTLQKKSISGIVEFVASGGRFRIHVDSETCLLSFLLTGVTVPRAERNINNQITPADAFGEEARAFARQMLMQRKVSIKTETMDKGGNFIGWLFINDVNFNIELLKEGLATVSDSLSESSVYYADCIRAEEAARYSKKNIWSVDQPERPERSQRQQESSAETAAPVEEADMDVKSERKVNHINAVCTEVGDNFRFYVHHSAEATQIERVMGKMQEIQVQPLPATGVKAGDLVASMYSEDNQWYRGRIDRKISNEEFAVLFIDYGNVEKVNLNRLSVLPSDLNTSAFPECCHEYTMAFVKCPPRAELVMEAKQFLSEELLFNTLNLNVEYKYGSTTYVSVFNEAGDDVGLGLVKAGKALHQSRREPKLRKLMEQYDAANQEARKGRLNMWRYGDISEEDHPMR